ncbi:hypothetical protein FNL55_03065 [Tardiphaga sp. vice352]|uniref:hypothetical protein n=1 Tax=unclassified Tardiphaga TaxID=2631404 RepID=UPI0011638853|nr:MULTISPECIES: hypothetical protein [unclassified Tardiphaga]QDM25228.1 hypothetical protein FNL56_02970 [Tardiphaga sp. vice304]QDM30439.1 hypothetical protein FNL55_03065 [Tardiphaga sp. vice352]
MSDLKSSPRLNELAIARVLNAAGVKKSRPHIDKSALAGCIDVCADLFNNAKLFRVQTIEKKERSQLQKVHTIALKLKTVLSKTPAAKFAENSDKFETALSDFVVNTERLVKLTWLSTPRTGLEHDYVEGRAYEAHFKSKSPLQWMVGVYLAEVYVLFIGEDLTGTYLDFACQVLKELKIKNGNSNFSRQAVARAARGYNRTRKSAPAIKQDEWTIYRENKFYWVCGVRDTLDLWTELRRREARLIAAEQAANISGRK